jgi:hypothetical protein
MSSVDSTATATQPLQGASGLSSIAALSPIFSSDPHSPRGQAFHVHANAQQNLQQICARLAGKQNYLVGLYVTESAEREYNPDPAQYGRVIALVRALPMPAQHTVHNYPSGRMEFKHGRLADRWPIGWPCIPIFYSPHGGPVLRDAVRIALGIHDYWSFASQFLQGPIDLHRMSALQARLMAEIRHEVARNPHTQLQSF